MNNDELKALLKHTLERHEGRLRAITAWELSQLTGEPDRQIRLVIRELITDGMPILSATQPPAGYFLPLTWEELNICARSMRSRLIEDAKRRRDLLHHGALRLKPAAQGKLL